MPFVPLSFLFSKVREVGLLALSLKTFWFSAVKKSLQNLDSFFLVHLLRKEIRVSTTTLVRFFSGKVFALLHSRTKMFRF
jgi:hypothetical protein